MKNSQERRRRKICQMTIEREESEELISGQQIDNRSMNLSSYKKINGEVKEMDLVFH